MGKYSKTLEVDGNILAEDQIPISTVREAIRMLLEKEGEFVVCQLDKSFLQSAREEGGLFFLEWSFSGRKKDLSTATCFLDEEDLAASIMSFYAGNDPVLPRQCGWKKGPLKSPRIEKDKRRFDGLYQALAVTFPLFALVAGILYLDRLGYQLLAKKLFFAIILFILVGFVMVAIRRGEFVQNFYTIKKEKSPVLFWLSVLVLLGFCCLILVLLLFA